MAVKLTDAKLLKLWGQAVIERANHRCKVIGCDKTAKGLGYCQGHYVQFKKYGKIINEKLRIYAPRRNNLSKIIKCKGCGKEFNRGKVANRLFCSKECSYKNREKKGVLLKCIVCGKEFYRKKSKANTGKYCSKICHSKGMTKKIKVICDYCGKIHFRPPSYIKWQEIRGINNHFCSTSCGVKFRPSGENHPKWKGGKSRAYKYGYHSEEYKQWHNLVFERDNFTCQLCNIKGHYLHAHHIKGFSHFPELRFCLSNGITLCKNCHMEVHSKKCKSENYLKKMLNKEAMADLSRKKR